MFRIGADALNLTSAMLPEEPMYATERLSLSNLTVTNLIGIFC